MRLRLSRLAVEDVEFVHDYTVTEWGEAQALKYVGALWEALEEISAFPERWRRRPDIHKDCRVRVYGRHLIVYRIRDGTVEVSRILHGAMNLRSHVPGDFLGEEAT